MKNVKASDLRLGDIVRFADDRKPYQDFTVNNIEEDCVHVVRPYIHTLDFSYTGGVPWHIGVEHFTINKTQEVEIVRRKGPLL